MKTNFRTAITVPEKSWAKFRDVFADYCEKMKEGGSGLAGGMGSGMGGLGGIGGSSAGPSSVLGNDNKGQGVAQVSSPSGASQQQQPNPNPNLDSPLIK